VIITVYDVAHTAGTLGLIIVVLSLVGSVSLLLLAEQPLPLIYGMQFTRSGPRFPVTECECGLISTTSNADAGPRYQFRPLDEAPSSCGYS
jgi:hypothetical protein